MAVTLTLEQLADHLRIERVAVAAGTPQNTVLTEMLALAAATVEQYAVSAPDSAHNIAAARMVGYAFDAPPAASMTAYGVIFVNSGAASLLNPWRSARADAVPAIGLTPTVTDDEEPETPLIPTNPVHPVHPGTHNRYVGWIVGTPVTANVVSNGQLFTADMLTIPDGGPGRVFFAVPEDIGYPDSLHYGNSNLNELPSYSEQADTVEVEGAQYIVGVSDAELAETAEGIIITLGYAA